MEILVAVIAFAGALLAAIAAGALVRNLREERAGWLIAWTVAAVALCLALGAVGTGYLVGFGPGTFKIYQLAGSLLAPLWMAIGLIQLLAEKAPPKFSAWLFGVAFTIVAGVILVSDPLLKGGDMGKALPSASVQWGLIPGWLLAGAHTIDALILLAAVVIAALRWRRGDEYDTDNLHATMVIAPSALALIGALRFSVPGVFTTALLVVAAAGIWYVVLRPLAPYDDDEEDDIDGERWDRASNDRAATDRAATGRAATDHAATDRAATGRRAMPEQVAASRSEAHAPVEPPRPRSSGLSDLVAEYRAGDQEIDYAARMAPPDPGPSTGYIMSDAFGRHGSPQTGPHQAQRDNYSMPGTGAVYPGAELFAPSGPQPVAPPAPGGSSRPSPNIFGLLTVFTLVDGSGEMFDRLAEHTVEAVRRGEPDTLVYACHAVKSAPLQRIVYELYRDEVAYHDHQRQPHVERFVNERQAMVLATNVIELNVNAAKVVPLPTAMF